MSPRRAALVAISASKSRPQILCCSDRGIIVGKLLGVMCKDGAANCIQRDLVISTREHGTKTTVVLLRIAATPSTTVQWRGRIRPNSVVGCLSQPKRHFHAYAKSAICNAISKTTNHLVQRLTPSVPPCTNKLCSRSPVASSAWNHLNREARPTHLFIHLRTPPLKPLHPPGKYDPKEYDHNTKSKA